MTNASLADLRRKELEMQQTLLELIKTAREDVSLTGQRAITQINTIRDDLTAYQVFECKIANNWKTNGFTEKRNLE